ncbi:MAG TPA: hypothetical protein VKT19_01300 [Steroidobacteraceae bacterium]|nr:hypothetical protein [Steroidobacteraceae bacterium]
MNKPHSQLPRLLLHLWLLPFVLFWVPLLFAMAWLREFYDDLRPAPLRPAPALLPARDPAPSLTRISSQL